MRRRLQKCGITADRIEDLFESEHDMKPCRESLWLFRHHIGEFVVPEFWTPALQRWILTRTDLRKFWRIAVNLEIIPEFPMNDWDLSEAVLRCADLRDAKLQGANLQGAVMYKADLRDAVLRDAKLQGADLRYAKLQGSVMRFADLSGADLRYAFLSRAELQGANLRNAFLSRAKMQGADLSGANLTGTALDPARKD